MTASNDDLHDMVDRVPEAKREEALALLRRLASAQDPGEPAHRDGGWSGDVLLTLAGSAEGPEDLSEAHDRYVAEGA